MVVNVVALLWFNTKNRGIHWLLPMDFRLREPGIVKQSLQLFWCVGGHSLHEVRPLGIGIDYLDHDGKTSTRLQHSVLSLVPSGFVIFLILKTMKFNQMR